VSIKFLKKAERKQKDGYKHRTEYKPNLGIWRQMCMKYYEYGRGGKCAYMFRYTYAGIREMKMQMEKEDRHMSNGPRGWLQTKTPYQFCRISVPVGPWGPQKIFLSSKMMSYQPQHIQKREVVDIQKLNINTNL